MNEKEIASAILAGAVMQEETAFPLSQKSGSVSDLSGFHDPQSLNYSKQPDKLYNCYGHY